jgi:hypothetical protein
MRRFIVGILAGWLLSATLYAGAHAIEASERYWPRMLRDADVPDTLGSGLLIAAMPVTFAGWDGEQPPDWMPFDLMLYGLLGVVATAIFARWQSARMRR